MTTLISLETPRVLESPKKCQISDTHPKKNGSNTVLGC